MSHLQRLTTALADRYRIEGELGAGGMATVYLAQDLKHDRKVALKVIKPDIAGILGKDRFAREIRLAARLQHPHICSVYDSGDTPDGQLWYTMPFVAGESLRDRLQREGRLPIGDAVRIIREAALGLAAAHAEGVIHRDLKPENILLAKDGTTLVADFGIAKAPATATGHAATQLTETGVALGTPAYMSPEQRLGDLVDARSDIYSLALTLYELLVGDLPPGTGGGLDLFLAQMTDAAPRMRIRRPEISEALEAVVRRGMAADPAQRYASMAEFQRALDGQGSGPISSGRASRWRGRGRLVVATLVIAAAGALLFFWRSRSTSLPTSAAVLPFADQSPGHDQAYFSDGLAEELTTVLARIPGLRVAARSSAFQFRDASINVRDVGRQLGVGAVLEGSVQRSGNRLRVSAQLVDSKSGYELWSEIYDRDLADVFQVQEEIARAIGTALKLRLAGGTDTALSHRPTRDLEAYDLYLKGRFAWNQRTGVSLPEAARYFEQAVARDSGLGRAWAGLADTYVLLPLYAGMAPGKAWPNAKAAALRAIALDGQSAEAYTSLAYGTMLYEWDWAASERSFHQAIAADSTYPTAHHWYADFLAGRGRLDEALVEMTRAQALDPLSRIIASEVGWLYIGLHRLDEADSTLTRLLRLDPNYAQSLLIMGQLRVEQRRYPEALSALLHSLALDGESAHGNGMLVVAYARAGERARARALLDSLTARSAHQYVPPFVFALGYANLGDLDRAFAEIERGIRERDVLLPENFFEPLLDPLKQDRRYAGVVARLR